MARSGAVSVPGLPPVNGVTDPQARAWMEQMSSAWQTRNGGSNGEQFVRQADLSGQIASSLAQILTGKPGQSSADPTGIGITSVQAAIDSVLTSKIVTLLKTPSVYSLPTQQLQTAVNKLTTSLSNINTKVDALEATGGNAQSLVGQEAEARAAGDTANAALITLVQSALYQDMVAGPNLVLNPGFVAGGGGWPESLMVAATSANVPANAPTDRVLRTTQRDTINQSILRVNQGEVLDATVWIASGNAGGAATASPCGLMLQLLAADQTTQIGFPEIAYQMGPGITGWTEFSGTYTVPAGVSYVAVDLQINQTSGGPDTVCFAQPVVSRLTGSGYVAMASIQSEATTRVNKDNALAQAINTVWAQIGGANALIQDSQLAQVSPAAVQATKYDQVVAAVTDPNTGQVASASVLQTLNSYASKVDGSLNSTWAVQMNTNNVATGFGLMTSSGAGSAPGTVSSDFAVLATRFSFVSATNAGVVPFTVDNFGNAIFNGWIYAAGGTFGGALNAATGTFAGALSAATGSFGAVTVAPGGSISSGQTAWNTGTGWWLGQVSGVSKFSIGSPTGPRMTWDGSNLVFDQVTASISGGGGLGNLTCSATGGLAPYSYAWIVTPIGSGFNSSQNTTGAGSINISSGATSATCTVGASGYNVNLSALIICLVSDANGRTAYAAHAVATQIAPLSDTSTGGSGGT